MKIVKKGTRSFRVPSYKSPKGGNFLTKRLPSASLFSHLLQAVPIIGEKGDLLVREGDFPA